MKRFTVPCDFGSKKWPFHIYVGEPAPYRHPLANQSHWLSRERGGLMPVEVMDSFEKLHTIAKNNNVSFEDLCVYALATSTEKSGDAQEQPEKPKEAAPLDTKPPAAKPAPADSLQKSTNDETLRSIFETGRMLWPDGGENAVFSRQFFLALALYVTVAPSKLLTLSEIYRVLSSDDVTYSLAVVMDTAGKRLPPLANTVITQWLNGEKWQRERIVFNMTATLVDFAISVPRGRDEHQAMRKALYQSMLEEKKE
jgi:Domain of unknown function (DUF2610)